MNILKSLASLSPLCIWSWIHICMLINIPGIWSTFVFLVTTSTVQINQELVYVRADPVVCLLLQSLTESNPACREGKDLWLTSSLWGSANLFNGKRRCNFLLPLCVYEQVQLQGPGGRGAEKWRAYQLAPPCYMWKTGGERAKAGNEKEIGVCVCVCVMISWQDADRYAFDWTGYNQLCHSEGSKGSAGATGNLTAKADTSICCFPKCQLCYFNLTSITQ